MAWLGLSCRGASTVDVFSVFMATIGEPKRGCRPAAASLAPLQRGSLWPFHPSFASGTSGISIVPQKVRGIFRNLSKKI